MFEALYIGATGMRGQQMQVDAIAQNVANLRTVGYRRSVVSFAEVAAALAAAPTASTAPTTLQAIGAGAMPTLGVSNAVGEIGQTGDPLNVAIDGSGFLEVTRPDGAPAYTRAGILQVNQDGFLAVGSGDLLSARIQIPSDAHDIRIDAKGTVSALVGDRPEPVELGRIELANFSNVAGLQPMGDNLYAATSRSGEPQFAQAGDVNVGTIKQGFLENSNVQMTDELVNLMLAQRAFELNSKVIQAADQLLGITNGLVR